MNYTKTGVATIYVRGHLPVRISAESASNVGTLSFKAKPVGLDVFQTLTGLEIDFTAPAQVDIDAGYFVIEITPTDVATAYDVSIVQAGGQLPAGTTGQSLKYGAAAWEGTSNVEHTATGIDLKGSKGGVMQAAVVATGTATGAYGQLNFDGAQRIAASASGVVSGGKFMLTPAGVAGQTVGLQANSATNSGTLSNNISFYASNTSTSQGHIQTANATMPAFAAPSDQRLKDNIVTISPADSMALIDGVRVVDFDIYEHIWWQSDESAPLGRSRGVIAQEYQTQFPDGVTRSLDDNQQDDPNGLLSVAAVHDWDLLNAVKYLKAEVDTLKAQVAALEGASNP